MKKVKPASAKGPADYIKQIDQPRRDEIASSTS